LAAGNWSSDTICEDTDLGLTMLELGWTTHYPNRRYGFGLLPDTFGAYKKQRHRWAYGGCQIVKKHWRRFLPGVSSLSREQKRAFLFGWMSWLGAEALGVVVEDLRGDAQGIALLDLAIVGDVRLEHEGHADPVARIFPAAAELLAERIGRLVEGDDVVAHVHVAVPVDPVGQHGGAVPVERRREVEIDHGVWS